MQGLLAGWLVVVVVVVVVVGRRSTCGTLDIIAQEARGRPQCFDGNQPMPTCQKRAPPTSALTCACPIARRGVFAAACVGCYQPVSQPPSQLPSTPASLLFNLHCIDRIPSPLVHTCARLSCTNDSGLLLCVMGMRLGVMLEVGNRCTVDFQLARAAQPPKYYLACLGTALKIRSNYLTEPGQVPKQRKASHEVQGGCGPPLAPVKAVERPDRPWSSRALLGW